MTFNLLRLLDRRVVKREPNDDFSFGGGGGGGDGLAISLGLYRN